MIQKLFDKYKFARDIREQNNALNFAYIKKNFRFPNEKPNGIVRSDSFLGEENKQYFPRFVNKDTKIIAEIGSWYGSSAREWYGLMKNNNADGFVIAIDTFRMSSEHLIYQNWVEQSKTMLEDFYTTNWDYRDKMLVMPMPGNTALEILYACKVEPDIIYIDGAHDEVSVRNDLEMCLALFDFRKTQIVMDDWFMGPLRKAVIDVCNENGIKYEHSPNNVCWIPKNQ